MATIDNFIAKFRRLRTYKDRNRWSALTRHQAPHKPFVLLSVMDLMAEGVITNNFIEPSLELLDTFNRYWVRIMPVGSKTTMAYPFPRLRTDGFWHLIPNPGLESHIDMEFSSMSRLREVCEGAIVDPDLFSFLMNSESRERLRAVLVTTYFAPEIQPVLLEQGKVNIAAYAYSRELMKEAAEGSVAWNVGETAIAVRDQGFRKAIVTLYDHRCALCGIRMLTPEGHTVVEAAHIKPWRESQDDKPTNGLALCRLCHWSFDEGLMSVGKHYEVLVSRRVQLEQNLPGHILTLSDRPIFSPEKQGCQPSQGNFEWHRKTLFRN